MDFSGVNKKQSVISKDEQEKMWNFPGSWFLALESPRNLTKIWNFQGWNFVWLEFPCVKQKKQKTPGWFSKKYVLNPPLSMFGFLLE